LPETISPEAQSERCVQNFFPVTEVCAFQTLECFRKIEKTALRSQT